MRTEQYTDGSYLEKTSDWHASDSPWKAANVYRMIDRHQVPVNSICDIGCGAGEILAELQKKISSQARLTGYDISPQAISIARNKENDSLQYRNEDFLETDTQNPDLILLLDVFEHVPDYLGFLEKLRTMSRWVIFHIPLDMCAKAVVRRSNYMMYMRETYGHLHYFSRETAIATLKDVGYDVVDYFYTDDYELDEMIPASLRPRLVYEFRKMIYKLKPDLAVSLFNNFNLMLLARGDLAKDS